MRKVLKLKTLLILIIFFSSTTYLISQNYIDPIENEFLKKTNKENIRLNEKNNDFPYNYNYYLFLGITSSQLINEDSFKGGTTLAGIFLIANIAIIIKKYNKSCKSEVKTKSDNLGIEREISVQENLVLTLVQDYLSKNRYLDVNKIVPYLNAQLSKSELVLNKNGIKHVITNLIKKNIIVDGSKLTRDDVLKNPNRLKIYNTILNNPGIHFMNIINLVGMSIFLVKWHLKMLLNFNFIKNTNTENRQIYFDARFSEKKALFLHFIGREKTQKILSFLKKRPKGSSKYRISRALKMHPNTVTKYIQKLEELDLLARKEFSNKTLYILKSKAYN